MATKTVYNNYYIIIEEDNFLVYNQINYDNHTRYEYMSFKSLIDAKTYCDLF